MADLIEKGEYTGGTVLMDNVGQRKVVFKGLEESEIPKQAAESHALRVKTLLDKDRNLKL